MDKLNKQLASLDERCACCDSFYGALLLRAGSGQHLEIDRR